MSLLVPVAAWPQPPVHAITHILLLPSERSGVVTGSESGQLCLWAVERQQPTSAAGEQQQSAKPAQGTAQGTAQGAARDASLADGAARPLRFSPRVMLLGHAAPICWLAACRFEGAQAVLSLCAHGFACVWDPADGRCLSSSAAPLIPARAGAIGAMLPHGTHAVLGGEACELVVVD
eukprot:6180816-Pleurochrysis_carterae.AAC.1